MSKLQASASNSVQQLGLTTHFRYMHLLFLIIYVFLRIIYLLFTITYSGNKYGASNPFAQV